MTGENQLQLDIEATLLAAGMKKSSEVWKGRDGFLITPFPDFPGYWVIRYHHFRSPTLAQERATFFAKAQPCLEAKYGARVTPRHDNRTVLIALVVGPARA
jgi:hypothetical protein